MNAFWCTFVVISLACAKAAIAAQFGEGVEYCYYSHNSSIVFWWDGVGPGWTRNQSYSDFWMKNYCTPSSYMTSQLTVIFRKGVKSIGDYMFANCTHIDSIIIEGPMEYIGKYAFAGTPVLSTAGLDFSRNSFGTLANYSFALAKGYQKIFFGNVREVGSYAFQNSDFETFSFTRCDIINSYAFYGSKMSSFGATNENGKYPIYIGDHAFHGTSLTGLSFANVSYIGECAFCGMQKLGTALIRGKELKFIGAGAFKSDSSLTSVSWGNNECPQLAEFGDDLFFGCSSLTKMTIPKSLTKVGYRMLDSSGIKTITVEDGNTHFIVKNGVLYDKSQETLFVYPLADTRTSFTIPASVKKIEDFAFGATGSLNLQSLTVEQGNTAYKAIGSVIYTIDGTTLFMYLHTLSAADFVIPDGVTTLHDNSFRRSTNLETVTCPDSLKKIGDNAFYGCKKLTRFNFGNKVESVGTYAFMSTGLKYVVLPESIRTVGCSAFVIGSGTQHVFYPGEGKDHEFPKGACSSHPFQYPSYVCVPSVFAAYSFFGVTSFNGDTLCNNYCNAFDKCNEGVFSYETETVVKVKRENATAYINQSNACNQYYCSSVPYVIPLKECKSAPACYVGKGTCNETTGECVYEKKEGYENLKEDKCHEIFCNNGEWKLRELENISSWVSQSNGCYEYYCDNTKGFLKRSLKTCNSPEACYENGVCNEATGGCVYEKKPGYDDLLKQVDGCQELVCNGKNEWALQERSNVTDWKKKTDKCTEYYCDHSAGLTSRPLVTCGDPPTSCQYGEGVCDGKTGECLYQNKEGYDELAGMQNECFKVVCENDKWVLNQSDEASRWESQVSECYVFTCVNSSGLHAEEKAGVKEWREKSTKCVEFYCDNSTGLSNKTLVTCGDAPACQSGEGVCNEQTGECEYDKGSEYDTLIKQEDKCNEVVCDGTKWVLQERDDSKKWKEKSDECTEYYCDPKDGLLMRVKCESLNGSRRIYTDIGVIFIAIIATMTTLFI